MSFRTFCILLWGAAMLSMQIAYAQDAPSQGGDVNLVRATATTMELKFGIGGTGQGRVLAMAAVRNGQLVPLFPKDGHFYQADSIYGKGEVLNAGYAVYSGIGHYVVVTGLKPNTEYYVANAEYNSDGTSITYNIRGTSMSTSTQPTPVAPLPIELTAFNGSLNVDGTATLHWTTATEHNSSYFALERSVDKQDFAEVGRLAAAGSSTQARTYHWNDAQRLSQLTYYRLRQVDLNGQVTYSAIVALAPDSRVARLFTVYPNPSAGQAVEVALQGFVGERLVLRMHDMVGHLVLTQIISPIETLQNLPLGLPPGTKMGTYLITLIGHGYPIQQRLVLSN